MAKYLTPARVSTLVLIDLYRAADFSKFSPESSTTFLKIIAGQCLPARFDGVGPGSQHHEIPAQDVISFAERLSDLESYVPGRTWLSVFLRKLWEVTTLDELDNVFRCCNDLLASAHTADKGDQTQPPKITRASPIGQFVRRCNVEFTRLQFADSMALWKAFIAYREPSREAWAQHHPEAAKALATRELSESAFSLSIDPRVDPQSFTVSADSIETVLSASIFQLQKLGQRIPNDVKAKIEQWLLVQQTLNLQSLHHFMHFFECWRAGQYSVALENLHRYFDYSVAKGASDNMKVYYQYALLHLSVLHADFERWEESMNAMEECIATARENQDTACLNFALSWLIYLRQSHHREDAPGLRSLAAIAGEGGSELDELGFLKAKAKESKHWALMSSTLLEEAKLEMRHHGVCAKALEHILQSSYLNVQNASYSLMPATMIFQAAIVDRLGQPHLAKRLHEASLSIYSPHCSMGDRTRIICRLAYDSAQRGAYDSGLGLLEELQSSVSGTLKLEQRVAAFAGLIALMRAIRRSDFEAAEHHLGNLLPMRPFADPDVSSPINTLEVALLMKQNRFDTALSKINSLAARIKAEPDGDISETLSLLALKASVFSAAGQSPKGLSLAIRAAATAERCHLVGPLTEALMALGRVLNDLSEFDAAKRLIEATLPHALEGSTVLLAAQLFVALGEAHVGLVSQHKNTSSTRQMQLVRTAAAYIERGREVYAKIDDYTGQLDCLLMKSRLAEWSGDEASAAHADGMYVQLMRDHEKQEA